MNQTRRDWVISWPNLEGLLSEKNSFRMLIAGAQSAWLAFDAPRDELLIEIEQSGAILPKVLPQAISLRIGRSVDGKTLLVLASTSTELRRYFYDFSVEVLELTQMQGFSPHSAVDEAWKRWGELIEQQSVLSRERQVGLLAELHLLNRLASSRGWQYAVDAWHRTARAEHDFCIEHCDIEVKATTSDRRVHTIGSVDQLQPSPKRPLYLLSNQFAVAPRLAEESFSLASLVESTLEQLDTNPSLQLVLKERLAQAGWREHHMPYYQTTFVVRSAAQLIHIDDRFPRIVPEMLTAAHGSAASRIESVMYTIDVSGLGWKDGTAEFEKVLS